MGQQPYFSYVVRELSKCLSIKHVGEGICVVEESERNYPTPNLNVL